MLRGEIILPRARYQNRMCRVKPPVCSTADVGTRDIPPNTRDSTIANAPELELLEMQ